VRSVTHNGQSAIYLAGAFSVVADGGYLHGIACRIDPSLQVKGNFDRAKLPVNSRDRILCLTGLTTCHALVRGLQSKI